MTDDTAGDPGEDPAEDPVTADLLRFIRTTFAADLGDHRVEPDTPLLATGILNSLRIAMLLNHIGSRLAGPVPAACIDAENFRDVRTLSSMVSALHAPGAPGRP